MKNRSDLKNILVIIFLILIILLILLVISLYKTLFTSKDTPKKEINRVIIKEYVLNNVDDLTFEFRNAKVYYSDTNNEKMIIKQYGKNNRFMINKIRSNNSIYFRELHPNVLLKITYKIYIPKGYLNKINIINGFGNIKVGNFTNDIKIDNNAGNVILGKIDNLDLKSVSGNINIKRISKKLKGSSSTGTISVDSLIGETSLDTITGDITIGKFLILNDSNIETTSGNINIKINKKSLCDLNLNSDNQYNKISDKVCLNGENKLKIKNVTGMIAVK